MCVRGGFKNSLGGRAIRPMFLDRLSVYPTQVHINERTNVCIETCTCLQFSSHLVRRFSIARTGGKNKHVELELFFLRFHPFRRDLEDGICTDVDDVDVVLIEDLVEILFLAWSPAAKRMGWDCGC